jgi:hypothetical protein
VAARKQKQRRMSAQVVEDEDYQLRYEVVAGIDVAKESAVVCVRMPPAPGRKHRTSHLQTVPATVPAIAELAAELTAAGVQMVSMEATSDYWRVWFAVLEEAGLAVQLVSSSQARNLPGRPKTDPLTDHLGVFSELAGRVVMGVATVAGHERRRGWPTRSGPAGGAALRVA